ncbi:MAG: 4-hydroxy-3-methylbut-2-enyl diphosphate reductase [bacterium]
MEKIILAKSAGFCFGVKLAVDCAYESSENELIYTYGPIIHNKNVVGDLEKYGVRCVEDIQEFKKLKKINKNFKVIIRSHGIPLEIYNEFESNNISYIDCTCPFVKKIHKIVYENYKTGKSIIIIGNKNHPEIIGINGFCNNTAIILEKYEEVVDFIENFSQELINYILVVQTTFDVNLFGEIKNVIIHKKNIKIFKTICNATNERQKEAISIAENVDIMVVLGDINSSNTQKLFSICKKKCPNTYLCEKIQDLQLNNLSKNVKIGVTAGASTPLAIIKEGLNYLNRCYQDL